MKRGSRGGFTFIETMIAALLVAIVSAELLFVFMGLFKTAKMRLWAMELAQKARVARERLLFTTVADGDSTFAYGGLLSAKELTWAPNQLSAEFTKAYDNGNTEYVRYEPGDAALPSFLSAIGMDDGTYELTPGVVSNRVFFINVPISVTGDSRSSNLVERIAVPVFGRSGGAVLWTDMLDNITINPPLKAN